MTTQEYKKSFPGHEVRISSLDSIEKMRVTKLARGANTPRRLKMNIRTERSKQFEDDLRCELCDFKSKFSLISHITRKHHITMSEYRTRFPGVQIQRASKEQKTANSLFNKNKLKDADTMKYFLEWRSYPSEVKHWLRKGFTEDEAVVKIREWQTNAALAQNNYPETLAARSIAMTGDNNHMSLCSLAKKHNASLEEAYKLTPCYGRTGEKHPMFGKQHSEESIAKIAASEHVANPDYRSKPERELENLCRQIAHLKTNVQINRYNVDVLFQDKNVIVEMFGDYWHMNPRKYKADDVNLYVKKTAQAIWDRDARKLGKLRSLGYDVIVVWEHDWRFNKKEIMEGIKDAYDRAH